jgi:hypothetical protein
MGNTRDTGYLQNLVTYDASGNIVLSANLTVNGNLLVATQSYVTTQINNLINGAPALLDTLDELAAALGDDASFASTITTSIAGKQTQLNGTGFVKVTGTTVSYDNSTYLTTGTAASTYLTTASATSTYLPLAGGTLTGALNGTSAVFSGSVYSNLNLASATGNQGANTTSATLFLGNRGYFTSADVGAATIRAISTGTFWYSGTALSFSTNPGPDVTSAGAVERVHITSGGNVGIGTDIPLARLQLNLTNAFSGTVLAGSGINNAGNNFSIITTDAQGENVGGMITFGGMRNSDATNVGIFGGIRGGKENSTNGNTSGNLGFYTLQSAVALAERMRITSIGNVGIGTSGPIKKLEIFDNNNSTDTTSGLRIINYSLTANARSGIVFQSYDNNGAAIWSNRTGTTTGELIFGTNNSEGTAETNIAERMRIYSDGVVTTGIIQLNNPTYFASNYYGIRLAGVDNGVNGTNFQIQGRTTPTGGFSPLLTVTNSGVTNFSSSVTVADNFYVSGGSVGTNTGNGVHLNHSGNFAQVQLNGASGGWVDFSTSGTDFIGRIIYLNSDNLFRFHTNSNSNPAMVIDSLSRVGIGTTAPTTVLDIGNGTLTLPILRGRTYQLSNVSSQNPNIINGTGFNSVPVRVGDYIDLPFSQTRIVTAVTDTQITVNSAWTVSFSGSNVEGRGGIVFRTNNADRMHITSDNSVLIPGNIQFNSILPSSITISLSGITAGSWFNIPEFNFNGFSGLVTINIQNLNSEYGYFTESSAWIFQAGANNDPSYFDLRAVTIRPDGTSQEGYNVVESYHTAPNSGRYNMRMRLRPRNTGSGAANPINLQIMVDNVVSITAGPTTLRLKRI